MAPIHETDLAEERWSKAEWNHYELWEKIEVRVRKKRRLWIAGTVAAFLLLSSIPIIKENRPRWVALKATRKLAQEISRLKKDAGLMNQAYRIRFHPDGSPVYDVEQLTRCQDAQGVIIRSVSLQEEGSVSLQLLDHRSGAALRVPGLGDRLCFDPLTGLQPVAGSGTASEPAVGFGLIPKEDLAAGRDDRMVVIVVSGTSAEITYD